MKRNINQALNFKLISPYIIIVRTFFLIFLIFLSYLTASSQLIDSISKNIKGKPDFFIKLDTRGSFVSNRHVRINGVKGGLSFNKKLKLGVGYNWLKSNYQPYYNGANVNLVSHNISSFIDYVFINKEPFEYNANIQLGFGNVMYKQNEIKLESTIALFYEQSISVELRVLKYLGLGFDVGYRFVVFNKKHIDEKLSAPVYIARLKLYFGDIYKDLKEK